jgi:hypothetical protein
MRAGSVGLRYVLKRNPAGDEDALTIARMEKLLAAAGGTARRS